MSETSRDQPESGGGDRHFEQLWVALLERPWRTLAVVPTSQGLSGRALAEGLARVGGTFLGRPLQLRSAEGLRLAQVRPLIEELAAEPARYGVVVPTDLPLESEAARLVARAADAALLLVPVGSARSADVKRVIELLGRERVVGAATVA